MKYLNYEHEVIETMEFEDHIFYITRLELICQKTRYYVIHYHNDHCYGHCYFYSYKAAEKHTNESIDGLRRCKL